MISVFLSLTGVETLQRDRVTAAVTQISKIAWRKKRPAHSVSRFLSLLLAAACLTALQIFPVTLQ